MSCGLIVLCSWWPGHPFDDTKCTTAAHQPWPNPILRWPQLISLQHMVILADNGLEITFEKVMTLTGAPAMQLAPIHPCPLATVLEFQNVKDALLTRSFIYLGRVPPSGWTTPPPQPCPLNGLNGSCCNILSARLTIE